ncbi:MAG: hypothetical protein Q7S87_09800 [Agitococcus sp.]|nr:hypothetical protein [Agitococcus sp.]MDO9177092.1 hypothetical protein [Agitococcus sp.]
MLEFATLLAKYPLLTERDLCSVRILGAPTPVLADFEKAKEGRTKELTPRGRQLYQAAFDVHGKIVQVSDIPFASVLKHAIELTNELRVRNTEALKKDLADGHVPPQQKAWGIALVQGQALSTRVGLAKQYTKCKVAGSNVIPFFNKKALKFEN